MPDPTSTEPDPLIAAAGPAPARAGVSLVRVVSFLIVAAFASGCGDGDPTGIEDLPYTVIRLESDPGDYIGGSESYEYTQATAIIAVSADAGTVQVEVEGDEFWHGVFAMPDTFDRFEPGSFTGLERHPFHDPSVGGLAWSGEGRGCGTLVGAFTVGRAEYEGGALVALTLEFEQHCEGADPALRGTIHWLADDPTIPPGPVRPIPDVWSPPAGATPGTGTYLYLVSDSGDPIGQGLTYVHTSADATFAVTGGGRHALVHVEEDPGVSWTGDFAAMVSLDRLERGYYPGLQRYPFHNPARGGLSWDGAGRACNTLTGWFAVDEVSYSGTEITSLRIRFEQHCEDAGPALRGELWWERPAAALIVR